ncbi:hypothetical protein [Bradyrhizobium oligotrophicum]|uniref:hypothetical protein n=1 Tax=Bradyrhizobium oligotrophicum TaxID=44255 RepID=UPI003EBB1359
MARRYAIGHARRANQGRFIAVVRDATGGIGFKSACGAEVHFSNAFKLICPVQSRREKFSCFALSEIVLSSRRPASARGAFRDRHDTRGGMRWALGAAAWLMPCGRTDPTHAETAWSWPPDAEAKPVGTMIRR